jgi:hypothetical protein
MIPNVTARADTIFRKDGNKSGEFIIYQTLPEVQGFNGEP